MQITMASCLAHYLLYRSRVAEPVARHHGVVDVLLEVIYEHVGDTGDTALRTTGVGFVEGRLAAECNTILLGASYFERKAHARYTATDDEKIILFHMLFSLDMLWQPRTRWG